MGSPGPTLIQTRELDGMGVKVLEAVVKVDEMDCVVLVMVDHGCAPVEVDEGLLLGQVPEVELV